MSGSIDVGKDKAGNTFIGVPDHLYDRCKTPLTEQNKHVIVIPPEHLEWLIDALTLELKATSQGEKP